MRCFLDRDGIINIDNRYTSSIEDFKWCDGIFELLKILKEMGYKFVLITNQSGLDRGYFTYSEFLKLTFYMMQKLSLKGIDIEVNYCRHIPESNCNCRKPKPGMILRYEISEYDIFIGDRNTDMLAANLAGIKKRWIISSNPSGPYTDAFKNHYEVIKYLNIIN